MKITLVLKDGSKEEIALEDLNKDFAHLMGPPNLETIDKSAVLIRQDTTKNPPVRVFRFAPELRGDRGMVFEEIEHCFINPPGI